MRVLSMFDGISCGRVALDRAGIVPEVYFASEIDKYAERVSAENWPEIVRLGDANGVGEWNLGPIDLLLGGSPCTHWSIAQKNNRETESSGIGWELFSLYVAALERYKPRYFLYENVKSMSAVIREEITRALGVEPIAINSALVSAQNRQRLYWTNIPSVEQPTDRGILLSSILEPDGIAYRDKAECIRASYFKSGGTNSRNLEKKLTDGLGYEGVLERIANGAAWRGRDDASRYEVRQDQKSNSFTAAGHQSRLVTYPAPPEEKKPYTVEGGLIGIRGQKIKINVPDGLYILRKYTVKEACRLQTLPDSYCKAVSDTQAYKAIGNGWTIDVIAHILGYMRKEIAIP